MRIQETIHEFCVIADYKDGGKFCMAKFMHEEDAREYLETREPKEWLSWKLYKRMAGIDGVRWECL